MRTAATDRESQDLLTSEDFRKKERVFNAARGDDAIKSQGRFGVRDRLNPWSNALWISLFMKAAYVATREPLDKEGGLCHPEARRAHSQQDQGRLPHRRRPSSGLAGAGPGTARIESSLC